MSSRRGVGRRRTVRAAAALTFAVVGVAGLLASSASGELASSSSLRVAAGFLGAGQSHTCAILDNGRVRCWGDGANGRLGYGDTEPIGDDETPGSVGPVDLGAGRRARAIAAGDFHACAVLDNGRLRCWGYNESGRLGYGNEDSVGDDETPGSVGPVDLGPGRTARAIAAGAGHTCAVLDNGRVRCWGSGANGRLGYGSTDPIGDDETPGSVAPVDLGPGRTAQAITAGFSHTCALLDNGRVRCWGQGTNGRLGYGNTEQIGDDETPGSVGPVDLGAGRRVRAIAAGVAHTCALLDNGRVRCWGAGTFGRLGYGDTEQIGDDETPGSVDPVDLGAGRTARAIAAGGVQTCALLDNGRVRCWGSGANGRLGYGNEDDIGDDEPPGSVGPVALGGQRRAQALVAGNAHTCAALDNGRLRCWGFGDDGRLGYGNTNAIGDDEVPAAVVPVDIGRRIATRGATKLTAKAKPRRDRTRPFRFRVRGRVTGLFVADEATCTGRVRLVARQGGRRVAAKRPRLSAKRRRCAYAARLRVRRPGKVRIKARLPGSSNLAPAKAKARARAG